MALVPHLVRHRVAPVGQPARGLARASAARSASVKYGVSRQAVRLALSFTVTDRTIGIEVVADPDQLAALDLVVGGAGR